MAASKGSHMFLLPYLCQCKTRFLSCHLFWRSKINNCVPGKVMLTGGEGRVEQKTPTPESNQPTKKPHPNLGFTTKLAVTLHRCDLSIQKAF